MIYDDLDAPLGQSSAQKKPRPGKTAYAALALACLGLVLSVAEGILSKLDQPHAALSEAPGAIRPSGAVPKEKIAGGPKDTPSTQATAKALAEEDTRTQQTRPFESAVDEAAHRAGIEVVRGGGGTAPEPLIIDVAKALNLDGKGPSARLHEQSHIRGQPDFSAKLLRESP